MTTGDAVNLSSSTRILVIVTCKFCDLHYSKIGDLTRDRILGNLGCLTHKSLTIHCCNLDTMIDKLKSQISFGGNWTI